MQQPLALDAMPRRAQDFGVTETAERAVETTSQS